MNWRRRAPCQSCGSDQARWGLSYQRGASHHPKRLVHSDGLTNRKATLVLVLTGHSVRSWLRHTDNWWVCEVCESRTLAQRGDSRISWLREVVFVEVICMYLATMYLRLRLFWVSCRFNPVVGKGLRGYFRSTSSSRNGPRHRLA